MNQTAKCAMCEHALTDEVSVAMGLGPECREKLAREVEAQCDADTTRYIPMGEDGDIPLKKNEDGITYVGIGMDRQIVRHSPTGLSWGYSGSGCADLALNVLLVSTKDYRFADKHYQRFKADVIAHMQPEGGVILGSEIRAWVEKRRAEDESEAAQVAAAEPELPIAQQAVNKLEDALKESREVEVKERTMNGHDAAAVGCQTNGIADAAPDLMDARIKELELVGGEVISKGDQRYVGIGPFLMPANDIVGASLEEFAAFLAVVQLRAKRNSRENDHAEFRGYLHALDTVPIPTVRNEELLYAVKKIRSAINEGYKLQTAPA